MIIYPAGYQLQSSLNFSGTDIDYVDIPSWVTRITIVLADMETSSTSAPIIQLGDSGGFETTGYDGTASVVAATSVASTGFTTDGFSLVRQGNWVANGIYQGAITLTLVDSSANTWVCDAKGASRINNYSFFTVGRKTLTATLTQIRLTTIVGTASFSGGKINVAWE